MNQFKAYNLQSFYFQSEIGFLILTGGFMVSPRLSFSGKDVSYLYPDCRTAMVGDFGKDGKMVEARLGELVGTHNSTIEESFFEKEIAVIDPRYFVFSEPEVIFLKYWNALQTTRLACPSVQFVL